MDIGQCPLDTFYGPLASPRPPIIYGHLGGLVIIVTIYWYRRGQLETRGRSYKRLRNEDPRGWLLHCGMKNPNVVKQGCLFWFVIRGRRQLETGNGDSNHLRRDPTECLASGILMWRRTSVMLCTMCDILCHYWSSIQVNILIWSVLINNPILFSQQPQSSFPLFILHIQPFLYFLQDM